MPQSEEATIGGVPGTGETRRLEVAAGGATHKTGADDHTRWSRGSIRVKELSKLMEVKYRGQGSKELQDVRQRELGL